ncbi:hypothetical protein SEPCBS57363_000042 [Sporothrix epigloea]|uniref:Aminotransferase class V domain-containing protein n=1 Tax=Sporothrix epigloea TaxID=1892477 RepID=A0ABP0D2L0_9PEZI
MASILDSYPEYGTTSHLDALRRTEYGYLDEQGHVYLDYTGSGLAARAQHRAHAQRQAELVLGNPHSVSPTSALATDLVEKTRARVLQHLNASPEEYAVVFTPNATGAARLVGEAYHFAGTSTLAPTSPASSSKRGSRQSAQRLILTADNHNSLNGLREYARRQGVSTTYVQSTPPDLHIDEKAVLDVLGPEPEVPDVSESASTKSNWAAKIKAKSSLKRKYRTKVGTLKRFLSSAFCGLLGTDGLPEANKNEKQDSAAGDANTAQELPRHMNHDHAHDRGLFAYPAQSNFSGVRHPLRWIAEAQRRGYDVLLDAAAYLPTATLDLQEYHPDFVLVSWYKLFGYPTGVGCLVARRAALARLDRPWFSGGTIRAVSVGLDWHAPAHRVEAQFEDGTVNFQAIPDVYTGLEWLASSAKASSTNGVGGVGGVDGIGGMAAISTRVRCLTGWFLDRLVVLRHSNGQPMIRLYGPDHCLADGSNRGGTVTFNFLDPQGQIIDERVVASEAAATRISLRTGCFCNPGAGETALGFSRAELRVLQALATNSKPKPSKIVTVNAHDDNGHHRRDKSSESFASNADSAKGGLSRTKSVSSSSSTPTRPSTPSSDDHDWPIAGAVRVSFGVASNTADVDTFFTFAGVFRDRVANNTGLGPRVEC